MEASNQQAEPASAETAAAGRDADDLRAENARLWRELHHLRAERREVAYYEQLAEQVTSSLSWRITTPLRSGKVFAARVRRKLAERRS